MADTLTARRLKEIAALHQKKYRERRGEVLVEGVRAVEAAVEAGAPLVEVLVTASARAEARVAALLARVEVPVYEVAGRDLERLSDVRTSQGVLAVVRAAWLPEHALTTGTALVVLDGVQDPGNVGTILRTAAWFGADAVLVGPGTADVYNPKTVRATMGGLWDLGIARTDDLPGVLERLRASGWHLYGADLEGEPARRWQPARPAALVLGSEAHGLSPAVRAVLHARVSIRGRTSGRRRGVESLNVATAAGILLHAWLGSA
ncbi:rRNA methyltransferase [Rhodothermaceae bacterium RA]|nr:rRNA methyltransferase [Rhodothermaceae bacterium RA]